MPYTHCSSPTQGLPSTPPAGCVAPPGFFPLDARCPEKKSPVEQSQSQQFTAKKVGGSADCRFIQLSMWAFNSPYALLWSFYPVEKWFYMHVFFLKFLQGNTYPNDFSPLRRGPLGYVNPRQKGDSITTVIWKNYFKLKKKRRHFFNVGNQCPCTQPYCPGGQGAGEIPKALATGRGAIPVACALIAEKIDLGVRWLHCK